MIQKIHPKHFIYFSFMELGCAPAFANAYDFRFIPVQFHLYYNIVPEAGGMQVINHGQVGLPVNAGQAEHVVKGQVTVFPERTCQLWPIFCCQFHIQPFAALIKGGSGQHFSNPEFQQFFGHNYSLSVLICSRVNPAFILFCREIRACSRASGLGGQPATYTSTGIT